MTNKAPRRGFFSGMFDKLYKMVTDPKSITFCDGDGEAHKMRHCVHNIMKDMEEGDSQYFEKLERAFSDDDLENELRSNGINFPSV